MKYVTLFVSVYFLFCFNAIAQEQETSAASPAAGVAPVSTGTNKIRLLITRAGETSSGNKINDPWFSAVSETYFYLRLQPIKNILIIPRQSVANALQTSDKYGAVILEDELQYAAKKLNATHILMHNYEIDNKNKSVHYLVELVNISDNSMVASIEKDFYLVAINDSMDAVTAKLLDKINMKPTEQRIIDIMKRPILSADYKTLKSFGTILADNASQAPNQKQIQKAIDKIVKIVDKEPTFAVAVFTIATFAKILNNCDMAAQYYNHLLMRNGLAYPLIYAETARNFRLCQSYDNAMRTLRLAEDRGWNNYPELLIEKALVGEKLNKNSSESSQLYEDILRIDPEQPDALIFKARNQRLSGNNQAALETLERLIKVVENPGKAYLEKAEILVAMKKFDEALSVLEEANTYLKDDPNVYITAGNIYLAQKNYEEASSNFLAALEKNPTNADLLLKTARSYELADNPQKAVDLINKYKSNFYDNKQVTKELGILKFMMKDTAAAKPLLEASVNLQPPDGKVFLALGDIYVASKDHVRAAAMYEKADPFVEDKNSMRIALANLYIKTNDLTKAEKNLRLILAQKPDFTNANQMLGDILKKRGEDQKALECFINERKNRAEDEYLQQQISQLYFKLNNLPQAEKEAKKLLVLNPENNDANLQLVLIYIKLKKTTDAEEYLQRIEGSAKINNTIYLDMARGFAASGLKDKAIGAFQKALRNAPSDEDAWKELAKLYQQIKNDDSTAWAYKKIFDLNPKKNYSYLADAGNIYFKIGLKEEAYAAYSKYIQTGHKDSLVNFRTAAIEFENKNYTKTIPLLQAISTKTTSSTDIVKMLALSLYNTSKFAESLPYLQKLVTKFPGTEEYVEMCAIAFEKSNDLAAAAGMYKKLILIKKGEKNKEYAFHVASLYETLKQNAAAISQYASNTVAYPDDFRNFEKLITLHLASNNLADASKVLTDALRKFPEAPPELDKKLAEIYVKQNKINQAAAAFEKYIQKNPTDADACYQLGSIYYTQNNFKNAIKPLEAACESIAQKAECFTKLGYAYYKIQDREKAAVYLQNAYNANKKDPNILLMLTDCYQSIGDTANLIPILKARVALEPRNYDLNYKLGKMLVAQNDIPNGIKALEFALAVKQEDVATHLLLASLYRKSKNDEKWLEHINAVLRYDPKNADIHYEKASYFIYKREFSKAKSSLLTTLTYKPNHTEANFYLGKIFKFENDYRSSYTYLEKAIKLQPENPEYLLLYAQVAQAVGKIPAALTAISSAVKLAPNNPEVLELAGLLYSKTGQKEKAVQLLQDRLTYNTNCIPCYEQLGYISYENGEFAKAIEYFKKSIDKNTKNDSLLLLLANSYYRTGQLSEAFNYYEKALRTNPLNDEALYRMCDIYVKQGKGKNAESLLGSNRRVKKSGWYYLAQGMFLETKGNYAVASLSYEAALRQFPKSYDAMMGLGRSYLKQKKYNDAIEKYSMAMVERPDDISIFIEMGKAYFGLNNFAAALELFNEVIAKNAQTKEVYYLMGIINNNLKRFDEAISALERSLQMDDKNGGAYLALGFAYENQLRFEEALSSYQKAIKADDSKAMIAYKCIGDVYYNNLKDNKNAKKYYTKYVEAGGTNSKVKLILKSME